MIRQPSIAQVQTHRVVRPTTANLPAWRLIDAAAERERRELQESLAAQTERLQQRQVRGW